MQLYIVQVKSGDLNQPALSPIILLQRGGVIHEQRWHHRYLSLPSLLPPPHPVFLLSHHLYFSPAFIFPVCSSAPFRSSSPTFLISRQMISETGFIPRPSSLPSICQSHLIPDCLPSISLPLSLSIYLLFLCSSGCLFSHRLSVLSSCHLPTRFSSFLTLLVFSSPFTILSLFSLIVSPLSDRFCFRPLHLAVAHPLHLMQLYQIWSPLCHFTFLFRDDRNLTS